MTSVGADKMSAFELLHDSRIGLVVFDVDGTLYDQRRLRRRMAVELMRALAWSRAGRRKIAIIRAFRRVREQLAEQEAENVRMKQYTETARGLGVTEAEVRTIVDEWLAQRPLRFLRHFREPGIDELFRVLRERGITVAVFSDYPAVDKLRALGLEADVVVAGTDDEVDRLKPHPKGLEHALQLVGETPERSLLIGDRPERDGECARRCGVHFLLKTSSPSAPHVITSYRELAASMRVPTAPSHAQPGSRFADGT